MSSGYPPVSTRPGDAQGVLVGPAATSRLGPLSLGLDAVPPRVHAPRRACTSTGLSASDAESPPQVGLGHSAERVLGAEEGRPRPPHVLGASSSAPSPTQATFHIRVTYKASSGHRVPGDSRMCSSLFAVDRELEQSHPGF